MCFTRIARSFPVFWNKILQREKGGMLSQKKMMDYEVTKLCNQINEILRENYLRKKWGEGRERDKEERDRLSNYKNRCTLTERV